MSEKKGEDVGFEVSVEVPPNPIAANLRNALAATTGIPMTVGHHVHELRSAAFDAVTEIDRLHEIVGQLND